MNGDPAIEVRELSRGFGARLALDRVSFQVPRGEVFGFLGPNGAGKTTTIRILTGQLRPDAGTARVLGYDSWRGGLELRRKIGVMFEDGGHYERLSVRSNLAFFARLYRAAEGRVEELLRLVALERRAADIVSSLSKGMRQRLSLARALVGSPQLLFLDEPTAGLDPLAARAVRDGIRDFAAAKGTVFLTTHSMDEAQQLCGRVAILEGGKLLACDGPEELCRAQGLPDLESVFVQLAGRSLLDAVEGR
ncbi:MAG: ABC transporter ATP-binding protein [Armatimonadetes bacterium]|nr:ABC transporter ATP-binding protein [Armatimonadota bacterium]